MAQRLHQPKLPEEIKFQRKSTAGMALSRSPKQLGRTVPLQPSLKSQKPSRDGQSGGRQQPVQKSSKPTGTIFNPVTGINPEWIVLGHQGVQEGIALGSQGAHKILDRYFPVPKMPGMMRTRKWERAATLMEKWIQGQPNDQPERGIPDTQTIKMEWVLKHERAKKAYDDIFAKKLWKSAGAQREIRKLLTAKNILPLKAPVSRIPFGTFSGSVPKLHEEHINYQLVGDELDPILVEIDELYAALGRFTFHVLVRGYIGSKDAKQIFCFIEEVGVYIRDSYDFNGDFQPLGYWDTESNYIGKVPKPGTTYVSNATFRRWRERNGRGGDYMIFSDVKTTKLSQLDFFNFTI
ncbi:MAG: hypothetical protein K1Y36_20750 [Blastocatellia bacterium]|nr:hypothetical protein [Blastocatellia bacterium]